MEWAEKKNRIAFVTDRIVAGTGQSAHATGTGKTYWTSGEARAARMSEPLGAAPRPRGVRELWVAAAIVVAKEISGSFQASSGTFEQKAP